MVEGGWDGTEDAENPRGGLSREEVRASLCSVEGGTMAMSKATVIARRKKEIGDVLRETKRVREIVRNRSSEESRKREVYGSWSMQARAAIGWARDHKADLYDALVDSAAATLDQIKASVDEARVVLERAYADERESR